MDEGRAYQAEFEALGEVEVNDRVERRYYEGADRAYAVRWLNDKSMARLTGAAFLAAPVAAELALLARNSRRSARWAMIAASVAGLLTVANIGFAAYAQMHANEPPKPKHVVHTVVRQAPRALLAASTAATPADGSTAATGQ